MATPTQKQASAARRAANRARGRDCAYPRVRARPIHAGRSYKITRRCVGRLLLLSPSFEGKVGYCLALAANLYGIQVHASVWMSNHHHTDVTDPHGNLVHFKQLLHSMIARGRNAQLGRFWSGDEASDTRRPTDDHALRDLVYTLTNPVKARQGRPRGCGRDSRLRIGASARREPSSVRTGSSTSTARCPRRSR